MTVSAGGTAVVIGGTGFVGRQVCTALAVAGHRVVVASRRPEPPGSAHPHVVLDLATTPTDVLAKTLDAYRPAVVVNATGSIWGLTDQQMWESTALPGLRLLDALTRMSGRPRLVHLGSVLEYGPVPPGTTVRADTPARPDTAYGKAKLAASQAAHAAFRAGRLDGLVLRVANVAGPGAPDVSLLGRVATCLRQAAAGTTVEIVLDPLRAHRDYVDVRDVADAVVAAAGSVATGKIVNIGRGTAVPVRTLVELLIEVSGVPATVTQRAGGRAAVDWLQVDTGPATALLDWYPRRSLADAVSAFWYAYRAS